MSDREDVWLAERSADIGALVRLTRSTNAKARRDAATSISMLAERGVTSTAATAEIIRMVSDPAEQVRDGAQDAVIRIARLHLPSLPSWSDRRWESLVLVLHSYLTGGAEELRAVSANALGNLAKELGYSDIPFDVDEAYWDHDLFMDLKRQWFEPTLQILTGLSKGESGDLPKTATVALANLVAAGIWNEEAVHELRSQLSSTDPDIKRACEEALSYL